MKHPYIAFVLDDESRAKIMRLFKPSFEHVKAHHVTLVPPSHEFTDEHARNAIGMYHLLNSRLLGVTGYAEGDGVDCVSIKVVTAPATDSKRFYHCTLSVAEGHYAKEANDLADKVSLTRGLCFITGSYKILHTENL